MSKPEDYKITLDAYKHSDLMSDWSKVSFMLYHGISDSIKFNTKYPEYLTENKYKEIEEALEVYNRQCMVSANFLNKEFDKLKEVIDNMLSKTCTNCKNNSYSSGDSVECKCPYCGKDITEVESEVAKEDD